MPDLTRRRWIAAAGAAAAAAGLPAPGEAAAGSGRSEAPPLPAPPGPEVYRERQAKLRSGAKARGWDALIATPSFEEANVTRDAIFDDVRTWQEDQDPFALTAKLLAKRTVGVEGSTAFSTATLFAAAAEARTRDATAVFDELRAVKSDLELAFMKDAGRRTIAAISGTHEKLRAGMTERDVQGILSQEFSRLG